MKILIIEDEAQAAWSLKESILRLKPEAEIIGMVDSVEGIRQWLSSGTQPDLIFSDIQLGDGTAFEAYQQIKVSCPIIFCTAYDEYVLRAFQSNGIDYLLKPIDDRELKRSFEKLSMFQQSFLSRSTGETLEKILGQMLHKKPVYKTNFLLPHRDKLIPIDTGAIVYFKVTETAAEVKLVDGRTYYHSFTLDYLSSVLDPAQFYRASRQYLVAFIAIRDIEHHDDRKLLVHLKEPCQEKIVVSKAKASHFLAWMQNR
jgi:DNA-binding LytR/AlgR family response regulator